SLDAFGDEDDRERVRERPDEEGQLPPRVALDEVRVPLEHSRQPDQLVAEGYGGASHAKTPLSASSSSCSCSNSRPVAAKKASSSVSALSRTFSSSVGCRQRHRRRARIPPRTAG